MRPASTPSRRSPPAPESSFIGRRTELEHVSALARASRLLTVIGPAGVGKTRLALEAVIGFDEGLEISWVDAATARDGERFLAMLASAAGVRASSRRDLLDVLSARFGGTEAVVVLDNCENMVEHAAPIVAELLSRTGSVRFMATSQRAFGLDGEVTYRLPPLSLPPEGTVGIDHDAIQLFLERAGLDPATSDATLIATICRRLDGIPLGIELAAAGARRVPLEDVAAEIADGLASVPAGDAGTLRHRTLQAAIEWSYQGLADDQRIALARLAIFNASFTTEAAERVGVDLDVIEALADRSLLTPQPTPGRPLRYRLLEAVRTFAAAQLSEPERARGRSLLIDHLLLLASEAEKGLRRPSDFDWLERLDPEYPDLLAGLTWAISCGRAADAADIISGLLWYWITRGRAPEVRGHLDAAMAAAEGTPVRRAEWAWTAGRLAQYQWDRDASLRLAEEGVRLGRIAGRHDVVARCVGGIAWIHLAREGDRSTSKSWFEDALKAAEQASDDAARAFALEGLATISMSIGDWPEAMRILSSSMDLARRGSPYEVLVDDYIWLSWVALNLGRDAFASTTIDEAMALGDRIDDPFHRSAYRSLAATLRMRQGRSGEARALLEEAGRLAAYAAAPFPRMLCDVTTALLAYREGDRTAADRLVAAADQGARSVVMHIAGELYARAADLACLRGDLSAAARSLEQARAWRAEIGGPEATIAMAESVFALALGDAQEAVTRAHVALSDAISVEARPSTVEALESLAIALAHHGSPDRAARLLGAVDAARAHTGWVRPKPAEERRAAINALLVKDIGPDEIERSLNKGEALPLDEAVSYAQRGRGPRDRPPQGWAALTPVEMDVVRLAAEGLSNARIAERLFVSVATVKTHLVHVYTKLGFNSRSRLAAEAARAMGGLQDPPTG